MTTQTLDSIWEMSEYQFTDAEHEKVYDNFCEWFWRENPSHDNSDRYGELEEELWHMWDNHSSSGAMLDDLRANRESLGFISNNSNSHIPHLTKRVCRSIMVLKHRLLTA